MADTTELKNARSAVAQKSVSADDDGVRLDRWFKIHYPAVRHGALEKMLRKGEIRVNGARVKANRRVEVGDIIRVPPLSLSVDRERAATPIPSTKAVERDRAFLRSITLYEDDALLILNKPFGLAVQGGSKTGRHIDGMLAALATKADGRPRLVHRLDRDTGGVLVLAKTRAVAATLGSAFQRHEIEKTYWALTVAAPRPREGVIDAPVEKRPIGQGEDAPEKMTTAPSGKRAVTDFQTIESSIGGPAFIALKPLTGRTHQLRVHCAVMETPIVGDGKYGGPSAYIDGVAEALHLFCREMRFTHPKTGKRFSVTAPLTGHMAETWAFFAFDNDAEIQWPDEVFLRSQ
ncbi:MAG: RluA family pseudouridine synthase [Pseudomonadota bacterium]